MAAIRKFFEKKRTEAKFKLAGRGHKLTETSNNATANANRGSRVYQPFPRNDPSESSQRAGAAALARFEQQPSMSNRSQSVIKAEALKELEAERQQELFKKQSLGPKEVSQESAPVLAVTGVYFKCPLIGPDVLPREEMKQKIREFLFQQLEEEKGLTSCLIIHSCNSPKEKVKNCVEVLNKYLDNLLKNPTEEKFRKIRVNNKVFQEKVACLEGTQDFLLSAGFELTKLAANENSAEEDFYVYPPEKLEFLESVTILQEALLSAEPIVPELDRNIKVLALQSSSNIQLPSDFYTLKPEDIKREQQLKAEAVEKNSMLRTKAMRERDEIRERRRYRYTLLRIRFPDGIILQGTFSVGEKFFAVEEFVREHLINDWQPFYLCTATGHRLESSESTLLDLQLIPAAVIYFAWDSAVAEDVKLQDSTQSQQFLKPETLALL